jgi:cytochrome c5
MKGEIMASNHAKKGFRAVAFAALLAVLPGPTGAADEGEKVYQESCTSCHDAKTRPLDAVRLTRAQWKDAIERMEGQGAQLPSGKKLQALLDWLEKTHGPQSAPADKK